MKTAVMFRSVGRASSKLTISTQIAGTDLPAGFPSASTLSLMEPDSTTSVVEAIPLATSSNGRRSGKPWKAQKTATVRTHLQRGVKTKSWEDRMQKTQKAISVKKLETELKDEKQADFQRRREITMERKKAAEERFRLEEAKAQMGARKAARLRRKAGRSKKING